jgi:hypothetical protein
MSDQTPYRQQPLVRNSSDKADQQVLPPDDRLRRIEGELQNVRMLCTQILESLSGISRPNSG